MEYRQFDQLQVGDNVTMDDGSRAVVLKKSSVSDEILVRCLNGDKMWISFYLVNPL